MKIRKISQLLITSIFCMIAVLSSNLNASAAGNFNLSYFEYGINLNEK